MKTYHCLLIRAQPEGVLPKTETGNFAFGSRQNPANLPHFNVAAPGDGRTPGLGNRRLTQPPKCRRALPERGL